ncbi:MAG TPA: MarR family transcriptional regulator [Thermoanaerobaculia bacterium]|jgi:DNA-binding MarR family transcriptional regulator
MAIRSRLLDELKQTRPFPSKAAEAGIALLRTANMVHREAEGLAQTEGISLAQYNVLRILRGARGPLPTMEIAERLIEQTPGITRLVTNLEEKGLLRREQWAGDRRQILCQITAAGLKLLERLDAPMDQFDDRALGHLTESQLDTLIDLLDRIRNGPPE